MRLARCRDYALATRAISTIRVNGQDEPNPVVHPVAVIRRPSQSNGVDPVDSERIAFSWRAPMFAHFGHLENPGWCGGETVPIALLLFLTGLLGGFAHCGPMCGPFVLAQVANVPDGSFLRRLSGGMLLPYHLGRATTYVALGAIAALLGASLASGPAARVVLAVLLLLAAALFVGQAIARIAPRTRPVSLDGLPARWSAGLAHVARWFVADPSATGRFALGVVLGFLPCGFLYAALAAAAATQTLAGGAIAMAGFALGTMPSLVAVGIGGSLAAARWRQSARHLLAPLFLLNGVVLGVLAIALIFGPG